METIGGILGLLIAGLNFGIIAGAYLSLYFTNYRKKRLARLKKRDEIHRELLQKAFGNFGNFS